MSRPRKQTYTLDMYLKKIQSQKICNDADVQRKFAWKPEHINELIVTVLTDDYIPPIILGEEENSQLHIVDGGCRSAALMKFRYGNHKITSSIENPVINYKKKVVDKEGNISWEDAEFNIKNKTYDKLPEELKEKFDEYQIETVIHESCDSAKISKYIKRYNNHVSMNTDQKAFTYIDKFAGRIHKIVDSIFFVECKGLSDSDKNKGVVERVVAETLMCCNHFSNWKTDAKNTCKYLNNNATDEEFDNLAEELNRLEDVMTPDIRNIFNKKDCFIFLTLFDKFTKLGLDDTKFIDFLIKFQNEQRETYRNKNGLLFDEVDKGTDKKKSTKDKQVVSDRLEMLENLMLEYLHIDKEELREALENQTITAKDIIKEHIDNNVDDEDMKLYELLTNDASEMVEDIDSKFLSDKNRPSFVAIVAYAAKKDKDNALKKWLSDYEKKCELIINQKQNYLHMKESFDKFLKLSA